MKEWRSWALLLVCSALATAAFAQPPGPGRGPGPPPIERLLERHADDLDLDADTRAAIRAIAAQARKAERPISDEVRTLQEQMRALLDADSPKLDDVMQWADRIGAAETELRKRRLRTMLEVRALLSPEQRKKLVEIFEQRRGWRNKLRGDDPPPEMPGADPEAEGPGEP